MENLHSCGRKLMRHIQYCHSSLTGGNVTFDFWPSFLHTLQTPPRRVPLLLRHHLPPSLLSNCALRRIELIGIVPFS